jgi:hypothetical protein
VCRSWLAKARRTAKCRCVATVSASSHPWTGGGSTATSAFSGHTGNAAGLAQGAGAAMARDVHFHCWGCDSRLSFGSKGIPRGERWISIFGGPLYMYRSPLGMPLVQELNLESQPRHWIWKSLALGGAAVASIASTAFGSMSATCQTTGSQLCKVFVCRCAHRSFVNNAPLLFDALCIFSDFNFRCTVLVAGQSTHVVFSEKKQHPMVGSAQVYPNATSYIHR